MHHITLRGDFTDPDKHFAPGRIAGRRGGEASPGNEPAAPGTREGAISGTENIPGIAGLRAAIEAWPKDADIRALKCLLFDSLKAAIPDAVYNGPDPASEESAPHILNVALPPVRSQTMLFALEGDGIYVSAGSACASRKQKVSPVLKAMGIPTEQADCSLRFSLSRETTEEEILYTAGRVAAQYDLLKKFTRR